MNKNTFFSALFLISFISTYSQHNEIFGKIKNADGKKAILVDMLSGVAIDSVVAADDEFKIKITKPGKFVEVQRNAADLTSNNIMKIR